MDRARPDVVGVGRGQMSAEVPSHSLIGGMQTELTVGKQPPYDQAVFFHPARI